MSRTKRPRQTSMLRVLHYLLHLPRPQSQSMRRRPLMVPTAQVSSSSLLTHLASFSDAPSSYNLTSARLRRHLLFPFLQHLHNDLPIVWRLLLVLPLLLTHPISNFQLDHTATHLRDTTRRRPNVREILARSRTGLLRPCVSQLGLEWPDGLVELLCL
jgi:hypothetical protein